MEDDKRADRLEEDEEQEEFVLIDLDSVAHIHIPPNAPYVLSGLDTLKPILVIDNNIKLIGEYQETIGTCVVLSESDAAAVVHKETGLSVANLFSERGIVDPQTPSKQIHPVASHHKVLKFRLFSEADIEDGTENQANKPS